jgi:uncharacterized YigZ family protein
LKSISKETYETYRDKGSKFHSFLFPAQSKEDFEQRLEGLKSKYPDATHHCTAYRVNPLQIEEFSNDDGEPSGSAGLPILNALKRNELVNAAAVVVRYYGGTKLGKSGLIEAYETSTELCIESASLQELKKVVRMTVRFQYDQQGTIEQIVHQFEGRHADSSYGADVELTLEFDAEYADAVYGKFQSIEYTGIDLSDPEFLYLSS